MENDGDCFPANKERPPQNETASFFKRLSLLLRQPHFGLNPNYAIHCSAFTINHGRTNARQWLRQAYSPPPGCDAFFPNASHWAELSRPFRALSAISSQHSAISRANKSTSQQFNNSPPLRGLRGLKARIISAPSRKGGVYRHPDLVRRAESLN